MMRLTHLLILVSIDGSVSDGASEPRGCASGTHLEIMIIIIIIMIVVMIMMIMMIMMMVLFHLSIGIGVLSCEAEVKHVNSPHCLKDVIVSICINPVLIIFIIVIVIMTIMMMIMMKKL